MAKRRKRFFQRRSSRSNEATEMNGDNDTGGQSGIMAAIDTEWICVYDDVRYMTRREKGMNRHVEKFAAFDRL